MKRPGGYQQHLRVLTMIDQEPSRLGDPPGAPGVLRRLCTALSHAPPARWVGVSLAQDGRVGSTLTGSDAHARTLEDLQFDLAEGPCVDSIHTQQPVLEGDIARGGSRRWPAYAAAAYQHGVRGVFAVPLLIGATCVGALDVYREQPAAFSPAAVSEAERFAAVAAHLLQQGQARTTDHLDPDIENILASRQPVYLAQGIIMADLRLSPQQAIALLRAYAYTVDRPVKDLAQDVVNGTLRLTL